MTTPAIIEEGSGARLWPLSCAGHAPGIAGKMPGETIKTQLETYLGEEGNLQVSDIYGSAPS